MEDGCMANWILKSRIENRMKMMEKKRKTLTMMTEEWKKEKENVLFRGRYPFGRTYAKEYS